MFGVLVCALSFITTFVAAKRNVALGIGVLMAWGYGYGVLRANFLDTLTHFMFDAGVAGLYLARLQPGFIPRSIPCVAALASWITLMIAWPSMLVVLPFDHPLVNLVGLRVAVFYLPLLLVGTQLNYRDLDLVAVWVSALNVFALAASLLEVRYGIAILYPYNDVTRLVYATAIGDAGSHRIPGTFSTAAAYGGTMYLAFPFILGAALRSKAPGRLTLLAAGGAAGVAGLLLCSCRLPVLSAGVALLMYLLLGGNKALGGRFVVVAATCALAFGVTLSLGGKRVERFLELQDANRLVARAAHVNDLDLISCMAMYPIGNGLAGAGGITIPYFLQSFAANRTVPGVESEYFRIVFTQGIPGIALWLAFLVWFFGRSKSHQSKEVYSSSVYFYSTALVSFVAAARGVGMLYGVPGICLLFVGMGAVIRGTDAVARRQLPMRQQEVAAAGSHRR